jgi:signal transduction histidine kinase
MNATTFSFEEDLHLQHPVYFDILHTLQENDFTRFLELAAFACNCPVAAIGLAGKEKKWFTTDKNLTGFAEDSSFYAHILSQDDVLVVTNTENDKRFNDKQGQFYAGVPILSTAHYRSGILCVMDTSPRTSFTDEQKNALKTIAHLIACLIELKVNNAMAIRDAHELVEAERKITRLTISDQDIEKEYLAYKLQENFAQTLAATKLFLEFAEQTPDRKDHFIQKSRTNISMVITEISDLCKSMVPANLGNPDMAEMLEDMINQWQAQNNIYVDFICGADLRKLKGHASLSLFNIIQQQLKLATYCNAKKAEISILQKKGVSVYFSITNMNFNNPDQQKELFLNNIYNRVALLNGQLSFESNFSENDIMHITIPGTVEENRYEVRGMKYEV